MPVVIGLMTMTLLGALGAALVLGTIGETAIAASYREGVETFYAAEAAVEFVAGAVRDAADWDAVAAGDVTSAFVDGPPHGTRAVGAATIDLAQATDDLNDLAAGPTYRPYAYGRFAELLPPAPVSSPQYIIVWVADLSDGVIGIVGRAYGPTGSRRSIAVSLAKTAEPCGTTPGGLDVLSWHELQ